MNRTERPDSTSRWPMAHMAWVLPVPGSPKARTLTSIPLREPTQGTPAGLTAPSCPSISSTPRTGTAERLASQWMHLVGDSFVWATNILARIASGSNEVFLLYRWGIWARTNP